VAVIYKKTVVQFVDTVGVEEAEALVTWLRGHPRGRVNLAECLHLHAAHLQVLMAAQPVISAWPRDQGLRQWLEAALESRAR
jgi:hypothetical protein